MAGGCAEPLGVPSDAAGDLPADAPMQLYKPAGEGPFPTVVVLHGCGGIAERDRVWAARLNGWGYAALTVDSFGPRGVRQGLCTMPQLVPPNLRARDAFAAAAWLRTLSEIDGAHIGVIGFSHGGWSVLKAISASIVRSAGAVPFGAAVAYYPPCEPDLGGIATDTLILIGESDDWVSAARCGDYVGSQAGQPRAVAIKRYPGAYHDFDVSAPERWRYGHHLVYQAEAAEDAFAMTRQFFDARLK
jgi:dienelactone hydrolase